MTLTPSTIRLDLKCGKGAISKGEKCHKGPATAVDPRAVAAVGLTAGAIALGALALSGRRRGGTSTPKAAMPGASSAERPSGPPRLPSSPPPLGLLRAAPPRQSKTQRMRANTAAAVRTAEGRIAQTAREEVRRVAQIGNTMASAGEATGMVAKTTLRELRLRTEAARRRFEPGYRAPDQRRLPGGVQAQLPQQGAAPQPEAIPLDPRTGQPRRRRARGFGRTDNFIQHYAPVQLQPPTRRDGPSTKYYRTHPEAAAKKVRTQAEINRRPEERKRRAELNRERRKRGIDGRGGPDVSHTTSGDTVLEAPSTNRARNGHGDQPRLRKDSGVVFLTPKLVDPGRQDACWAGYVQAGMKRKGKKEVPNCVPASSGLKKPRAQRDAEGDGKKYTKVVTNPETGRKNRIRYGAQGYKIAPGTDKGDRYCARSFGDMKSEGYDCSGAERNTPLCLSRAKWRCSGKTSRRDGLTPGKFSA